MIATVASTQSLGQSMGRAIVSVATLRGLVILILLATVGVPLLFLVYLSFQTHGYATSGSHSFSFANYASIFSSSSAPSLLLNTLIFAICSTAIGLTAAFFLAWLSERTDMPGRTVMRVMMFSWMAVPPLVFGYGWILALNPNNGVANTAYKWLTGSDVAPFNPYSWGALLLVGGLSLVPTAFIMISGVLRNMSPALEDAARMSGASALTTLRTITVPALMPGLLSAAIFLFVAMVQTFDLPLILGLSARIPVLSTRIYILSFPDSGQPNFGLAAAFGTILCLVAMLLMVLYFKAVGSGEKFMVVSGKGYRPRRAKLGWLRIPAVLAVGLYLVLMVLPLLILAWASLLPFYAAPSFAQISRVSWSNYLRVWNDAFSMRALTNSVVLMVVVASLVMVLSFFVSWISIRFRGRSGKLIEVLSFLSLAIPPIVLAVALLFMYVATPLYGTIALIALGQIGLFVAFGTRTISGALVQMHRELEDAAAMSGASRWSALRYVMVPLVWPQIVGGWLWVAAHSARDLTIPLVLMTGSSVVASSAAKAIWDFPDLPKAAALSIVMVMILMLMVLPVEIRMARQHGGDTQS